MTNEECKSLCLRLMHADTEDEVIHALTEVGLWGDPNVWRYYGDIENNYSTIGNQQSRPDAALVEKLINSVDARLMNECLARGIDPTGADAPQSIRAAVAMFFEDSPAPESLHAGRIENWSVRKRTEIARGITIAATGPTAVAGNPSFTISDSGEGQTPFGLPGTILSLHRENKLRIPFVQGKFNMGGTGALKFAGRHNFQLVVSRRNPALLPPRHDPTDDHWGFTLVRREDPTGGRRSSVYTYLAPVGADSAPSRGAVLHFASQAMPIFPDGNQPYAREATWGTLLKLYEYDATGFRSHMLLRDGLQGRVDLLLPEVALPIRFHECRPYRGHRGSPDTTLTGLTVRLNDDKAENLEPGFPASCDIVAAGEAMTASVYAFRKGKAESYKGNEGIVFTINGQTHGHLTQDFFRRERVGMSYLARSLLVIVDCSNMSRRAHEDLFMNSRDRLSDAALRRDVERELEDLLRNHPGLRELRERRQREQLEEALQDEKPFEDLLAELMRTSPTLAALFQVGTRVSAPFRSREVSEADADFRGRRFPTFFKFKGLDYGKVLRRDWHMDSRCRITFETDAENDYFQRTDASGRFELLLLSGDELVPYRQRNLVLVNGIASLSLALPEDVQVGDTMEMIARVTDPVCVQPFENLMVLNVVAPTRRTSGGTDRRKPPGSDPGRDREKPGGIEMPRVVRVHQTEWAKHDPPFDQHTALRVVAVGAADLDDASADTLPTYDFYVNVDNLYLRSEQKLQKIEPRLLEARFVYGLALLGMGLLRAHRDARHGTKIGTSAVPSEDNGCVEDRIADISQAVAPVLLPMIERLGALTIDEE